MKIYIVFGLLVALLAATVHGGPHLPLPPDDDLPSDYPGVAGRTPTADEDVATTKVTLTGDEVEQAGEMDDTMNNNDDTSLDELEQNNVENEIDSTDQKEVPDDDREENFEGDEEDMPVDEDGDGVPDDATIVDGDILVRNKDLAMYKKYGFENLVSNQAWGYFPKWGRVIPYVLDRNFRRYNRRIYNYICQSIRELNRRTCLTIRPRRRYERGPYIYFQYHNGGQCYSQFGRPYGNGRRLISLGRTCTSSRTPAHEIIHALGRFHEQARPDRDRYITVHWQNIRSNCRSQYRKQRSMTLGVPYDYYSVMHYNIRSCSWNGRPTMTIKTRGINLNWVGRESWLTGYDIMHIQRRYCRRG